jgi:molybdenum cofactor guanylyltransferase
MLGVVLAGGAGRRMGRDKALVEVEGEALWKRQVRVLRDAGAQRVHLIRRRSQAPLDHDLVAFDAFDDSGPLAGLHAALGIGGDPLVAVLAVDMPGIDAAWFTWLRGFCREGVGAVARHEEALEPLAAIYPVEALSLAAARLASRELSVSALALELEGAGRMTVVPMPAGSASRVASLNAPPASPTARRAGCS